MKFSFIRIFLFAFILGSILNATLDAKTFKQESYSEVDSKQLTLQLKDFKNKKVHYSGTYKQILATFPKYVDRSGIKEGKYYYLVISPKKIPVIVKRDKEFDKLVLNLEKYSTVQVFGKIKEFRHKPSRTMSPHYFLELVHLKVLSLNKDSKKEKREEFQDDNDIIKDIKDNNNNRKPNWKKRKLRKLKN